MGSNWECELQFQCSENKKCESGSTDVPQFETQSQVTSRLLVTNANRKSQRIFKQSFYFLGCRGEGETRDMRGIMSHKKMGG
jgi:hypothetical protein